MPVHAAPHCHHICDGNSKLCKWNWDADLSDEKQKREIGRFKGVKVLPKVYMSTPALPTGHVVGCLGSGLRAGREHWLCLVYMERYWGVACT